MFKTLFPLFFIVFLAPLFSADKVEIYATTLDSLGKKVKASGGVTVMYKEYFLTAQSADYDRESGDLELFGNIRLNHGNSYKVLGDYAKINIAKKERLFRPFFMSENETKVWLTAQEGIIEDKEVTIESGVLSGCNPIDPMWKIEFSSSDYNAHTKWMNVYNARLYLGDIPIMYTPYFGYSLDTTRRSGLLMPSVGYSNNEGIFYEQPIYIAEQNWWDLELRPQIRTSRGRGIYQTMRFVDSKSSYGEIKAGYFKEYTDYYKVNNLQNDSHYGYNARYENRDILNQLFNFDLYGQSGLYIDINNMNDVDYINLATNDTQENSTATQVLSRVNLFYNTADNYFGSYFKYYQDLTLVNNDETLQKLPTLQYHYYLDTLFDNNLLYSLDIQSSNITRSKGTTVLQTDVNLPVVLRTTLLDEYLDLSYKANIQMQHSKFDMENETRALTQEYDDGLYLRNYHTFEAATNLTKAFEEFSHVVSFGVSYNQVGTEFNDGYYKDYGDYCESDIHASEDICEFYNLSTIRNETKFNFIQYIFDRDAKQVLYHRLAQTIAYSEYNGGLGELENEFDYRVTDYLSFYNNMFYNYNQARFSKIFNQVSVSKYGVHLGVSHLFKDSFLEATEDTPRYTSYLTSSLRYTYNKHYSYSALYNYDAISQETKSFEVGFMYTKRCWDFGISYSENNRPILTTNGESSIYDRYIYLTIVLKPLVQANGTPLLTYQLPNSN